MIKFFFILALITGGIFAFSVLEEVHNENPKILAQLDQAWQELVNGEHNDLRNSSTVVGRGDYASTAAARPSTSGYAARSNARPDVGASRYSNNATRNNNSRYSNNNRNNTQANTLAVAYKQWRNAVTKHRNAMRASRNGGHDAACRAALQEVYTTKYRYDTLRAQAHAARR
jgi:hypothetical protein